MRSLTELTFRLRQELANAALAVIQPGLGDVEIPTPLPGLPEPCAVAARLQGTPYARQVVELAQQIVTGQLPVLGLRLDIGKDIRWRKDYVGGIETHPVYFRRIPYLDPSLTGDHKIIWEMSRHQHLVLLAQAYLIEQLPEYLTEIQRQLENWMDANPFQRGINWTSALEVGFRALSWIWIYHFIGGEWTTAFRRRFLNALNQHGLYLEYNLSVYFSPNTHLLGEALALYALGRLMPQLPRARSWEETGASWVRREMGNQVLEDGAHFEQSAYYHVYATDMFLFFASLAKPDSAYLQRLARMADYLDHLMGPSRILPLFGDDDGGRMFHPYGTRTEFGRGTLAACSAFLNGGQYLGAREDLYPMAAWWLGPRVFDLAETPPRTFVSTLFPQTGMASLFQANCQALMDVGEFGALTAGHSHADTLSLIIRRGAEEILIDPGSYTYMGDPVWRNHFRGSAFHNTVTIDGLHQGEFGGPFSWLSRPSALLISFEPTMVQASCSFSGFTHRRTVTFEDPSLLTVVDEISGPPGKHLVAWFWHFGIPAGEAQRIIRLDPGLKVTWEEGGQYGWRSPALGIREPAPVAVAQVETELPCRHETEFHLG